MGQERARVAAQRRAAPGRRRGAHARGDFARITFYTYLVDHIHSLRLVYSSVLGVTRVLITDHSHLDRDYTALIYLWFL